MDSAEESFTRKICVVVFGLLSVCAREATMVTLQTESKEYCRKHTFDAQCQDGEVIMMTHAMYGRMRGGGCADAAFGHIGCKKDILPFFDHECSGKQSCNLLVTDLIHLQASPCPDDVTPYLEAAYTCIAVMGATAGDCRDSPVLANGASGYLASTVSHDTNVGSASCPWLLSVPRGQSLNITLYDFGLYDRDDGGFYYQKYFSINEPGVGTEKTDVTAGTDRVRTVYQSTTNEVQIHVFSNRTPTSARYFLIRYQAIGCRDPDLPPHTSLERPASEGVATVICDHSPSLRWTLRCRGQSWVGKIGNCSTTVHAEKESGVWMILFGEDWSSPSGILIVIGFGIALGIVIGLLLLAVAILCMRRMKYFENASQRQEVEHAVQEEMADSCKFSMETGLHEMGQNYQEPLVRDTVHRVYADGVYKASLASQDSWPRRGRVHSSSTLQRSKLCPPAQHIYETPESAPVVRS